MSENKTLDSPSNYSLAFWAHAEKTHDQRMKLKIIDPPISVTDPTQMMVMGIVFEKKEMRCQTTMKLSRHGRITLDKSYDFFRKIQVSVPDPESVEEITLFAMEELPSNVLDRELWFRDFPQYGKPREQYMPIMTVTNSTFLEIPDMLSLCQVKGYSIGVKVKKCPAENICAVIEYQYHRERPTEPFFKGREILKTDPVSLGNWHLRTSNTGAAQSYISKTIRPVYRHRHGSDIDKIKDNTLVVFYSPDGLVKDRKFQELLYGGRHRNIVLLFVGCNFPAVVRANSENI